MRNKVNSDTFLLPKHVSSFFMTFTHFVRALTVAFYIERNQYLEYPPYAEITTPVIMLVSQGIYQ